MHVLVPELVPLDNKGEEAIVRGIADVLYPQGNCHIHLFDEIDRYEYSDGIHVYPLKWFISPWLYREFGLGPSWEKMRDSFFSIVRNGLHKVYPAWVKRRCVALDRTAGQLHALANGMQARTPKDEALLKLLDCDYVIAGHDGALDERVCQVIDVFASLDKRFGVFGVELPLQFKSKEIVEVDRNTLSNSEFFYCRTKASQEVTSKYLQPVQSSVLADPAFGMLPATDDEVDALITDSGLDEFFLKPVILCTSCEPPPISRHCFEETGSPVAKLSAHRDLFAGLIEHIARSHDVNILFLPHATGPGEALDDRRIAQDILQRSGVDTSRARVLETAFPARLLKGLIGRGEFLVAERIHSMIGSVGVNTPFLFMGSKTDRRIQGITCEMLGMADSVYYLNRPSLETLILKFEETWGNRGEARRRLERIHSDLANKLEAEATVMRSHIATAAQLNAVA